MGRWAKRLFGRGSFEEVGIVLAGTNPLEFEKNILSLFDKVISSKDSVYHAHLVKKNNKFYPIVFNIYGAPAMVDVLTEMHDGGSRTVIFVGYAYGGFRNLDVGSVVIPDKAYHFDGIYSVLDPSRTYSVPDKDLSNIIKRILDEYSLRYFTGPNISVPAVTFQRPHDNEDYKRINPLTVEMEVASFYSRSKDLGMRATALLIISDNRKEGLGETKQIKRETAKNKVLQIIISNLEKLKLPKLKLKKEFSIDEHLASIIENPEDMTNVYRDKNK